MAPLTRLSNLKTSTTPNFPLHHNFPLAYHVLKTSSTTAVFCLTSFYRGSSSLKLHPQAFDFTRPSLSPSSVFKLASTTSHNPQNVASLIKQPPYPLNTT
ncbi:hypothetical protein E2C01_034130 [Portunus trituberculatus]|uniref:Uncharacterized protein n=1 Tax=Portunus trituberculatus TaxID=210409 RepID=A0A5B7F5L9_PORTR|nr:hypothetical protein [Portunus trituberculatus]